MKIITWKSILTFFSVFILFFFILSPIFFHVFVPRLLTQVEETRKLALLEKISTLQLPDGSLGFVKGVSYEFSTAWYLHVLYLLGQPPIIDYDKAFAFIGDQQNLTSGGIGRLHVEPEDYDLYMIYFIINALNEHDALDYINTSLLARYIITNHYNETIGAFYQPIRGKWAYSAFPIYFKVDDRYPYLRPNILSTFSAVSTLALLNKLDLINISKVTEFILKSQTPTGAFAPFPNASTQFQWLLGWSSLITNPFPGDAHGGGIPYTYAALMALYHLGKLELLPVGTSERLLWYLNGSMVHETSFVGEEGTFFMFLGANPYQHHSSMQWAHQAIIIMKILHLLEDSLGKYIANKVVSMVLRNQELETCVKQVIFMCEIPNQFYGLFSSAGGTTRSGDYFAIEILNATNSLHLLDEYTPRQHGALIILYSLRVILSTISSLMVLTPLWIRMKKKNSHE